MLKMSSDTMVYVLAIVVSVGCSQPQHSYHKKETVPVSGYVTVDGTVPDSPITVKFHPVGGIDQEHPTISQTLTGDNGQFAVSTYEEGDGVPPGEYVVTFFWGKFNAMSMSFAGPDQLKNRYATPEKSPIKVTVASGKPVDMGEVPLTTK